MGRCDECGKFCKRTAYVYTGGPMPEPDHQACERCAPELFETGADRG